MSDGFSRSVPRKWIPWAIILVVAISFGFFLLGLLPGFGQAQLTRTLTHFQVGMTKEICRRVNGAPSDEFATVTEARTADLGFEPPLPEPGREGTVDAYSFQWFCVYVYWDEDDVCFLVHVGFT